MFCRISKNSELGKTEFQFFDKFRTLNYPIIWLAIWAESGYFWGIRIIRFFYSQIHIRTYIWIWFFTIFGWISCKSLGIRMYEIYNILGSDFMYFTFTYYPILSESDLLGFYYPKIFVSNFLVSTQSLLRSPNSPHKKPENQNFEPCINSELEFQTLQKSRTSNFQTWFDQTLYLINIFN